MIDATNPASPHQVANLEVPGASHEDVAVYTAAYGPLAGHDIAAVGLQYCASARTDPAAAGKRGLGLWDVTTPATPSLLAVFDTGCCTRGFHELEVGDRADLGKTFVYASLPYAERADPGSPTGVRDRQGRGEAWIVDVTDPAHPALVSTFGIKKDLGLDPAAGQGCFALSFGHGMDPSEDGKTLFVSYWDAGFLDLDIANPYRPRFVGRFTYPADADGDAHSTSYRVDSSKRSAWTGSLPHSRRSVWLRVSSRVIRGSRVTVPDGADDGDSQSDHQGAGREVPVGIPDWEVRHPGRGV